jgi:hypothetical protein
MGKIDTSCRIYWGSHGCYLERGHEGPHWCCCDCKDHNNQPNDEASCVGAYPYYGRPETNFYGEDAADDPLVQAFRAEKANA